MSKRVLSSLDVDNPELPILVFLLQVLGTADEVLRFAHPALDDPERPYWMKPSHSEEVAAYIVSLGNTLGRFIRNYQAAIRLEKTQMRQQPPVPVDADTL